MRIDIPSDSTVSTLKKSKYEKLEIAGMKEGIHYIFNGYKNNELKKWTENDVFKKGDKITLEHYFKPYDSYGFAFEDLNIIAGRSYIKNGKTSINNLVLYFDGIESAKTFIEGIDFEIDKMFALNKIRDMNIEIAELKKQYNITF